MVDARKKRLGRAASPESPATAALPGLTRWPRSEPSRAEDTTDLASGWDDSALDAGEPSDRYEDRGRIGRGGMAEIRRVFDRKLRRELAMKVLDWECVFRPT